MSLIDPALRAEIVSLLREANEIPNRYSAVDDIVDLLLDPESGLMIRGKDGYRRLSDIAADLKSALYRERGAR